MESHGTQVQWMKDMDKRFAAESSLCVSGTLTATVSLIFYFGGKLRKVILCFRTLEAVFWVMVRKGICVPVLLFCM